MSEPISNFPPILRDGRNAFHSLIFGGMILAFLGNHATAGVIRGSTLSAKATVQIQKADPNSNFWVQALKHHTLRLGGPMMPTVITLNADGSVPASPFMLYMKWREGLNIKRFDSFHPEMVKLLRKIKRPATPTTPGTIAPPSPGVPIQPPDFTPIAPITPQQVTPPNVPEPSSIALAIAMIGVAAIARRRRS